MHHNDSILILQLQSVCNRQYAVLQNILQFFFFVCVLKVGLKDKILTN